VTPSADLLDALRAYDTPTLANALDGLTDRPANEGFTRPPIRNLLPDLPPMVGYAVTATITSETPFPDAAARTGAMTPLYRLVEEAPSPSVIVVQDLDGGAGCLWGEVNSTICAAMGCEGVVTDGLVRDLPDVEAVGFRYLARGIGVARSWVRIVDTGVPVTVVGMHVVPGDVVHADRHGALVVPAGAVAALPAAADAVMAREQRLLDWVRSPAFVPGELAARRAQH
jgi:4-hydroxy-4-methyl-2-oxoglutarate aldolase